MYIIVLYVCLKIVSDIIYMSTTYSEYNIDNIVLIIITENIAQVRRPHCSLHHMAVTGLPAIARYLLDIS